MVENREDKILYIVDKCVHFTRILPLNLVNDYESRQFLIFWKFENKMYKHYWTF